MSESEIIRLIKNVLRQELAPILMGAIISNESQSRSTFQRFATDSPIGNARTMQPYGISSRAPPGTSALIVPLDANPTNLNIAGFFDDSRPATEDGETILYNQFGQLVYLSNGKIQIGSKSSDEPLVLGNVFKQLMDQLLSALAEHVHPVPDGTSGPPDNAAVYSSLQESPIDDNSILSDVAFSEKGS